MVWCKGYAWGEGNVGQLGGLGWGLPIRRFWALFCCFCYTESSILISTNPEVNQQCPQRKSSSGHMKNCVS